MSLFRGGGGVGSRRYGLISVNVERLRRLCLLRCLRHLEQRKDDDCRLAEGAVSFERKETNLNKLDDDVKGRAQLLSDMVWLPVGPEA